MKSLDVLLRLAGVCFLVALVYFQFFAPNPGGLNQHPAKRPSPGIVWRDAAYYASEAKSVDLLSAFVISKVPDARDAGVEAIANAEPTTTAVNTWVVELNDPDRKFQYKGLISLAIGAHKLGYAPKNLPTAPALQIFNKNPDVYVNGWRAWWAENHGAILLRAGKRQEEPSPDASPGLSENTSNKLQLPVGLEKAIGSLGNIKLVWKIHRRFNIPDVPAQDSQHPQNFVQDFNAEYIVAIKPGVGIAGTQLYNPGLNNEEKYQTIVNFTDGYVALDESNKIMHIMSKPQTQIQELLVGVPYYVLMPYFSLLDKGGNENLYVDKSDYDKTISDLRFVRKWDSNHLQLVIELYFKEQKVLDYSAHYPTAEAAIPTTAKLAQTGVGLQEPTRIDEITLVSSDSLSPADEALFSIKIPEGYSIHDDRTNVGFPFVP